MALERWFWTNLEGGTNGDGLLGVLNQRLARLSGIVQRIATALDALSRLQGSASLTFAAPGAVPGSVSQTITVTGAVVGNRVSVAAPFTVGANYVLSAFVSAPDTVTVRWTQVAGAAASPGAAGTYTVDVWQ